MLGNIEISEGRPPAGPGRDRGDAGVKRFRAVVRGSAAEALDLGGATRAVTVRSSAEALLFLAEAGCAGRFARSSLRRGPAGPPQIQKGLRWVNACLYVLRSWVTRGRWPRRSSCAFRTPGHHSSSFPRSSPMDDSTGFSSMRAAPWWPTFSAPGSISICMCSRSRPCRSFDGPGSPGDSWPWLRIMRWKRVANRLTLEVRVSNTDAIALYEASGISGRHSPRLLPGWRGCGRYDQTPFE